MSIQTFSIKDFFAVADRLAQSDKDLAAIIEKHGYPPMWQRPNTFETIVHFILEQQVSLASALAALHKLKEKLTQVNPENVLSLSDEEMRACYVSRQKMGYIRGVAHAISNGSLNLHEFPDLPDDEVKAKLVALKGIGNWTAEVYMMFVLQRADIFPVGDIAAVNALRRIKNISEKIPAEEILNHSMQWKPYRTIATMILWHHYLSDPIRKIKNRLV